MSDTVYDERPTVARIVVTIPLPVPSPDEKMGGRLADLNEKFNNILGFYLGILVRCRKLVINFCHKNRFMRIFLCKVNYQLLN